MYSLQYTMIKSYLQWYIQHSDVYESKSINEDRRIVLLAEFYFFISCGLAIKGKLIQGFSFMKIRKNTITPTVLYLLTLMKQFDYQIFIINHP